MASLPPDRLYPNDEASPVNALRAAHRAEHLDQIEAALEMLVARAEERQLHGAPLAEKQAVQHAIADSYAQLLQNPPSPRRDMNCCSPASAI